LHLSQFLRTQSLSFSSLRQGCELELEKLEWFVEIELENTPT